VQKQTNITYGYSQTVFEIPTTNAVKEKNIKYKIAPTI